MLLDKLSASDQVNPPQVSERNDEMKWLNLTGICTEEIWRTGNAPEETDELILSSKSIL